MGWMEGVMRDLSSLGYHCIQCAPRLRIINTSPLFNTASKNHKIRDNVDSSRVFVLCKYSLDSFVVILVSETRTGRGVHHEIPVRKSKEASELGPGTRLVKYDYLYYFKSCAFI